MKWLIVLLLLPLLAVPVAAMDFTAPEVPSAGEGFFPNDISSFGDGLHSIFEKGIAWILPTLGEAVSSCMGLIAISLLVSVAQGIPCGQKNISELVGIVASALLLLKGTDSMIYQAEVAIEELTSYGKLLFPVMAAAVAAQGGAVTSTALYAGTIFFINILTTLIHRMIVPMVYIYLCLSIANSAIAEDILKRLQDFAKWVMTWTLKILLYIFMAYIGITGVVSGTVDSAAIKAAKLTISGVVPVVGGILADASETVLVSAGVMKNAAGIYGLLAVISLWIGPFIKIGCHYLVLKASTVVCGVTGSKKTSAFIQDYSSALGFLLASIGSVSLLLFISTVCFMRGVG